jgi:hypothetical protein
MMSWPQGAQTIDGGKELHMPIAPVTDRVLDVTTRHHLDLVDRVDAVADDASCTGSTAAARR